MALIKLNNRGVRNVSAFGSVAGGSMTFIKKLTASSSATLSFVDGTSDVVLDDTYKEYLFTFNNIHPETDNTILKFNASVDSGSNYNVTKTTTSFDAFHSEADDAVAEVEVGTLAYWPPGSAFCIFWGPTPVSTSDKPKAYSPVNILGEIIGDATLFQSIKPGQIVTVSAS